MCATILKPHDPDKTGGHGPLARFFRWFNEKFDAGQAKYERGARGVARNWKRSTVIYALIIVGMGLMFWRLPPGFLPEEDQSVLFAPSPGARRRDVGADGEGAGARSRSFSPR